MTDAAPRYPALGACGANVATQSFEEQGEEAGGEVTGASDSCRGADALFQIVCDLDDDAFGHSGVSPQATLP